MIIRDTETLSRVCCVLAALLQMGMGVYAAIDDSAHRWQPILGIPCESFIAFCVSLMLASAYRPGNRTFSLMQLFIFVTALCLQLGVYQAVAS